jgi:hypothetical protein
VLSKGKPDFTGKITASTTGNDTMAAVPWNEELVHSFYVHHGDCRSKHFKLLRGHDVENGTSQARPVPVLGEDYLELSSDSATTSVQGYL